MPTVRSRGRSLSMNPSHDLIANAEQRCSRGTRLGRVDSTANRRRAAEWTAALGRAPSIGL